MSLSRQNLQQDSRRLPCEGKSAIAYLTLWYAFVKGA
jgi:hypothetical protein